MATLELQPYVTPEGSPSISEQRRDTSSTDTDVEVEKPEMPAETTDEVAVIRGTDEAPNPLPPPRAVKRQHRQSLDDVLVGTRVSEGHENFVTAYNMLTGIRVAVSRCNAKNDRPLTDSDFYREEEMSFDLSGTGTTAASKYDFRFKDYAPWVFRHLREIFKLDPADYLMSLTAKYIVSELGSPGKSGSFFYYSRDYRFVIKTIRHAEHKQLRKILHEYYHHVKNNPNTLLSQIYGLHRVRLPFGRKIHFLVMNNVFPALYEIHEKYDLKGSLLGRSYLEDSHPKPVTVYKDLDWLREHKRIIVGPEKRENLLKQLESDVRMLERANVMDYSLLVGIHDMKRGNSALGRLLGLQEFGPIGREGSEENRHVSDFAELQRVLSHTNPQKLTEFTFADNFRSEFYFYHDHCGYQSTDENNQTLDVIYYVGIIDFLTGYTFRKRVETFCKGFVHKRSELSAVPAAEYGERFLKFMRWSIGSRITAPKSSTDPSKANSTD